MQSKRFEIFLVLISIFYFLFIGFVVFSILSEKYLKVKSEKLVKGNFLKNFDDDNLVKNENIFFIDGNAGEENNLSDFRRACGVESAGNLNFLCKILKKCQMKFFQG